MTALQTVAQNASTGVAPPRPIQNMFRRALGVTMEEAAAVSNDARFLTGIVPSGNIVATAAETARFFQLLLNGGELDGVRIFEPRTLHRATQETSHWEADGVIGLPIRYGLGFMLGADVLSLYGHSTPRAFGHLGFTHLLAWADPDRELAVALLTAGKPFAGAFLVPLISRYAPQIVAGAVVCGCWLTLALGLLLAPELFLVWVVFGGLGQAGGFVVIFTTLVRVARGAGEAAGMSALVQGGGYVIAASSAPLIGLLHQLSDGWTLPMLVIATTVAVFTVCVLAGVGAARRADASTAG